MNKKYKLMLFLLLVLGVMLATAQYMRTAHIAVLQSAGPIGLKERQLIFIGLGLSLIIVLPVFTLLFFFAWKYRESNEAATYSPELAGSRLAETIWWVVPSVLILIISLITWQSSHSLDPFKPLASVTKPLTIQVVALDWKWLFIYPEQHIAAVNVVQFPVSTPVNFEITADAPMNSFWIPRLGGQIYAMAGMSTQLHLMADQPGSYNGSSANISGSGFAGMKFTARASSALDFKRWVNSVKQSPTTLSMDAYNKLAEPSENDPRAYYSSYESGLYDKIIMKYMMPGMAVGSTL